MVSDARLEPTNRGVVMVRRLTTPLAASLLLAPWLATARPIPVVPAPDAGGPATWARTFGGPREDKLYAVAPTADGGALAVGSTRAPGIGGFDGWVLRLDRAGRPLWQRRDGGRDTEQFYGVVAASDGGAFVAGHTRSTGVGESDLWIQRLDRRGVRLWERTVGGLENDRARALAADGEGGVVAAGFSGSAGAGGRDLWVVALDGAGELRWQRRFGGPDHDMAYAVATDGGGGAVVAGYVLDGPAAARDFDWRVIALDGDGGVRWDARLDRTPFDLATAVAATPDGGAIVAGTSARHGRDVRVARFDATGALSWERVLAGAGRDTVWGIALTAAGPVLAGSTGSSGAGSQDLWLVGLDRSGATRFTRTYGGALWDRGTAVHLAHDGGLWVAGYTTSTGAGFEDGWVLKLDASGRR
jgi:hypothetical protein